MRRGGLGRVAAAMLIVWACVGVALGQDAYDDEAEARVLEACFDLTADDAETRAKAAAVIAGHAPASIQTLMRGLPDPEQHEGWAAALDAVRQAGAEGVLREIEAMGSAWGDRGGPVVARFVGEVRDLWKDAPIVKVTTEETTLPDPSRLPPGAALPIGEALPSDLSWGEHPVQISKKGALEIATVEERPDRFNVKIPRGGWKALELGSARWPRRLMVFDRGGRWYVASAALRVGEGGGARVELLDVDGDGEYGGEADLIAVDGGAFLRIGRTQHVWAFGARTTFRVRREGQGVEVHLARMPEPEGPGRNVPAWQWVNEWRSRVGLAPQALDRPRSEACREHHDYWKRNGFSAHDQNPKKPGASPTGARAGRSSSVWQQSDPVILADAISRNILHRRTLLARESQGLGVAGGSAGSLIWGGSGERRAARTPLLVPGPGQRNVPLTVRAEIPTPPGDPNFYGPARGYPIAVYFEGAFGALSNVSLSLETADGGKVPEGVLFTPADPYHPNYNANEAVFLTKGSLRGNVWYLARFRATDDEGEFEVAWWFCTGDARFPARTGR